MPTSPPMTRTRSRRPRPAPPTCPGQPRPGPARTGGPAPRPCRAAARRPPRCSPRGSTVRHRTSVLGRRPHVQAIRCEHRRRAADGGIPLTRRSPPAERCRSVPSTASAATRSDEIADVRDRKNPRIDPTDSVQEDPAMPSDHRTQEPTHPASRKRATDPNLTRFGRAGETPPSSKRGSCRPRRAADPALHERDPPAARQAGPPSGRLRRAGSALVTLTSSTAVPGTGSPLPPPRPLPANMSRVPLQYQALGEAAVELRVWKKSAEGRLGPSRTSP